MAELDELEQLFVGLQGSAGQAAVLRRVAAFLDDLPAAWDVARPEESNALARAVFQSVEIASNLVTAIVRQPEFVPYFNLLDLNLLSSENDEGQSATAQDPLDTALAGGSYGLRSRNCTLPTGAIWIARARPSDHRGYRSAIHDVRNASILPGRSS